MKAYRRSIFIFRRDLRLEDNAGLNGAAAASAQVLPAFFLDPRQLEPHPYRSEPGLAYLLQSLAALDRNLKERGGGLHCYPGAVESVLGELIDRLAIEAVFINRDYTPFSRARDLAIAALCRERGVTFHVHADALLNEPEEALKADGNAYRVFTPYYRNARQLPVARPETALPAVWLADPVAQPPPRVDQQENRWALPVAGREGALQALAELDRLTDYATERDLPALEGTSELSVHLKFGTCSVREAFHRVQMLFGADHPLLRQFYWRDFFTHVAWHWPRVFEGPFDQRYNGLVWSDDTEAFERWCQGRTGFPIVDAGMRQLLQSGRLHNRVRMVVASFLVKDLHIDWRRGERHFARYLLDYDPCLNNGNWQWAASTGCDAQPWFRIFNPWRQQRRFDPEASYIRRWVPELTGLTAEQIHRLENAAPPEGYPAPMIDHGRQAQRAKALYGEQLHAQEDPQGELFDG